MPLQNGRTYAIRNELTHTVLDLTGNLDRRLFVMGWGWHGNSNQQWTAIKVDHHDWRLQNQQLYDGQRRFLSPQLEDAQPDKNYRLVGGILSCEFVIQEIGATGTYRILYGGRPVSLVTGEKVHKIEARDVLLDLYANGTPIALQPWAENPAQIWSFHDMTVAFPHANEILEPLTDDTAYKIVNSKTGTVLDIVTDSVGKPVHALASKGGGHHNWIVGRDPARAEYSFRSPANDDLFLAPEIAQPRNGTALIGQEGERHFLVRKVPDTQLYKIFLPGLEDNLAVNLAVVDREPDSVHGAIVSLQAAEAQTWYFIKC